MNEPDFWTNCGEAMELSVEGQRLIAREVAEAMTGAWRRIVRSFDAMIHGLGQHQHLPPL